MVRKKRKKKREKSLPPLSENRQRALLLHQDGNLIEAARLYEQILQVDPKDVDVLLLSGTLAHQTGDNQIAIELISKALSIKPNYAKAHFYLGIAFEGSGQLEKAIQSYQKALAINPKDEKIRDSLKNTLNDLGNICRNQGRFEEAIRLYREVLSIEPNHDISLNNLGIVKRDQGKLEEALTSYQRALSINPDFAEAYANLGQVYKDQGKLEEALTSCRRALSINPDLSDVHTVLIFIQDFLPDTNLEKQQLERQKWNQRFILPLCNQHQSYSNQADPDHPLRIGYVSADFRRHSAAIGFADLILNYDKKHFQVYCYSGVKKHREDATTICLQQNASGWCPTKGLKDIDLVEQIRNDKIDILVDLSGHTAGNRLLTFGYKPAPIQVTGIGHSSPGLSTIDYRLTTRFFTLPEEESLFPEQPIYLDSFLSFYLHQIGLAVSPLPAKGNGFLTFGCLNRWVKVSSTTLALWVRVLLAIPNSRLILKASQLANESLRGSILGQMKEAGVSEKRIDLRGGTSQQEHLAVYQEIDISLDPFPHGGGITSMESVWMGVPVISLYGDRVVSRAGATTLCPLGLGDWVVKRESEYIELAQDWSQRLGELEQLRVDLRPRVEEQAKVFLRQVEEAYRRIWQRWCRSEKASPLSVSQN